MTKRLRIAVLALAGTALSGGAFSAMATTAASPCQALNSGPTGATALQLDAAMGNTGSGGPAVLAVQANDVPANSLASGVRTPAVCEVGMVIASDGNPGDSQIQVAMLLPEGTVGTNSTSTWNGRFLGTGNGGFAGSVASSTLVLGVAPYYALLGKTFAVANTDMGDGSGLGGPPNFPTTWYDCDTLYCGSQAGAAGYGQKLGGLYGNPVAIADFGRTSTHLMTVAGKALTQLFYGQAPTYSYFHGCSTGGQQALMEAESYPSDYNGIVAGSPAYDRTHLHIGSAAYYEMTHWPADGSGFLTPAGLALAHQAVLAQCAGRDGGLKTDNFLMRPALCKFDASTLDCTGASTDVPCDSATQTSCTCLLPNQAASLNAAWSGAKDSNGAVLYPGYERGVEDPNAGLLLEEEEVSEPLFDSLDYWALGPNFTWQSLFANTTSPQGILASQIQAIDNTPVGNSTFAAVLNADNANLAASQFVKNGGKLIMYAGYEDPLIPSASSIDFYQVAYAHGVKEKNPVSNYLQLYMAPGMWHCNGGPGANAFGNLSPQQPPLPGVAFDDITATLVAWVENGTTPGPITATKYVNDDASQGIDFQRPLCPYPASAQAVIRNPHKTGAASDWTCVTKPQVRDQGFGPGYGPQ